MSDVNNGADNTVNWGERLDYNPGGGFYVNRYANDQIGWEKSYKLNAGIEFVQHSGWEVLWIFP